ncbi:MAG: exodeoxyribonuclease VII small subunit [Planctomycetales bacterium]
MIHDGFLPTGSEPRCQQLLWNSEGKASVGRTPNHLPVIYARLEESVNMASSQIGHQSKQFQTEAFVPAQAQTGIQSVAGRKSQTKQADNEAPSFEGSIVELQNIVGQLEDGSLPLEESMEQFERGISLLRNCYQVLEQVEQRIEVLTSVAEDGTVETEDFDASATFDLPAAGAKSSDSDKPAARKPKTRRGPTSDESLF